MHVFDQFDGHLQLLGGLEQLIGAQVLDAADLGVHHAHVAHGLHHVARAGLALGADHRGTFGDAAQRLAQVASAADERHVELGLIDVVRVIGRGQHLGLVDVVDVDGLQHLGLHEVADAALGHNGDGHGLLDALDHLRVAHAGHTASGTDVGGDTLERHDGASARLLGDMRLLGRGDVHDDAALQHLGKLAVQGNALFGDLRLGHFLLLL